MIKIPQNDDHNALYVWKNKSKYRLTFGYSYLSSVHYVSIKSQKELIQYVYPILKRNPNLYVVEFDKGLLPVCEKPYYYTDICFAMRVGDLPVYVNVPSFIHWLKCILFRRTDYNQEFK